MELQILRNMKLFKAISLFILSLSFFACEEMVDLDLRMIEPMNVIDARITEGEPCIVILSKTQDYYNNTPYQYISGAVVSLTDSKGKTEILKKEGSGIYMSNTLGVVGETYHLKVTIGENVYDASATIPEAVPINRVYIYAIRAGDKSWYNPAINHYDPPGIDNYYYTILSVNEQAMSKIYLHDDEFRDGLEIDRILFFEKEDNNDKDLEYGDHMRAEMQTLDKGTYDYCKSLFSAAEGSNPVTNVSGGALGCFKAYNTSFGDGYVTDDNIIYSDK